VQKGNIVESDDKELLELAAKAVGIQLDFTVRGDHPPYYINERGGHSSWNPLENNDDAFKLSIDLDMGVSQEPMAAVAIRGNVEKIELYENHPYRWSATRRAIVRVAADVAIHDAGYSATQRPERTN
jgi:hypothetical protein